MAHAEPPLSPEAMRHFTAIGKPFIDLSPRHRAQVGLANVAVADTPSAGVNPGNDLPVRYTDESFISVPALRPEDINNAATAARRVEHEPEMRKRKKRFWQSLRASKDSDINGSFIIKKIPRGEHLKHYAKDDGGRYRGVQQPAVDCLLRGEDLVKWRGT